MNRRQFTQSLAAAFATPLLPTPSFAAVKAMASSARPLHQFKAPYAWAAFTARCQGQASAAMFETKLGLSPAAARDAYAVLCQENVLLAPNAAGLAQAARPLASSHAQVIEFNARARAKRALDALQHAADQNDPAMDTTQDPIDERGME